MKRVCEVAGCAECPLRKLYPNNTFVAPKVGAGLRLAVGEAPGEEEAEQGEPFVGGSGRWLRGTVVGGRRVGGFYGKAGVKDEELSLINIINCRPPDNVFPSAPEARGYISKADANTAIHTCLDNHTIPFLKSRPWKRIDLIGGEALYYLTGRAEGPMKWRGSPMAIPALGDKLIAIPTLHPSYVARDQVYIPVVINDLKKSLVPPPERYNLFPTLADVQAFTAKEFCFDIETPEYRTLGDAAPIAMVGLAATPFEVLVVPFTGAYKHEIKRIFREATDVIGHNCTQFDLPRLHRDGIDIGEKCCIWDTMLMQHLRFPNLPHDLEFVGSQFTNKPAWKHDKSTFELYCARDVDVTLQAYKQLRPMIQMAGLMDLYQLVQVPLAKICHLMTETGFKQDPDRLKEVRTKFLAEMVAVEQNLPEDLRTKLITKRKRKPAPPGTLSPKTGKPVKFIHDEIQIPKSPWRAQAAKKQLLYEKLGLPVQYQAKPAPGKEPAPTTDKGALDKLLGVIRKQAWPDDRKAEATQYVVALRKLGKIGTLLSGFLKEEYERNPRRFIHPSFNVHGTSTGRLSSSDPNFQNQPETARYMYVPRHANWKILSIDFSGIENRIMALFAKDTERLKRMDAGISEHKYATSMFFGIPYELVEKDNDPEAPYNKAKHIVHGTDRGMGFKKIHNMYGIALAEAKRLQGLWKDAIAPTIEYQKDIAALAKRQGGWLVNPFGRKGWFYTSSAYTESISFMPQSTGADVIFRAMIGLMYERIGWPVEQVAKIVQVYEPLPRPANLLVSVHDELVFEYPEEIEDELLRVVSRVMGQRWPELGGYSFPITISVGPSWGEVEQIKCSL